MNKENSRPATSKQHKNKHSLVFKTPQKMKSQPSKQIMSSRSDYHDQCIRMIIATNAEYFQNKVRVTPNGRPKDLRFKIPCRTGMTIYKKDYNEKEAKYKQEEGNKKKPNAGTVNNKNFFKTETLDLKFNDQTIYQKEFQRHPMTRASSCRRLKKRVDTVNDDDKIPGFYETHNKSEFLNWAGKNYVPSMKPSERSAVTNLPFEATSSYRTDFEGKSAPPTPLCLRESSFPKFGNISMMMKSNYSSQFFSKTGNGVEINCKPMHIDATLCKQFKGTTEYKRQYSNQRSQIHQSEPYKNLQDLQNLIIDL